MFVDVLDVVVIIVVVMDVGFFDIFVNFVGFVCYSVVLEIMEEDFDVVVDLNFKGVYFLIKVVV